MLLSFAASSSFGKTTPHILHVIVDDFGFANTNYNRAVPDPEVVTPNMDELVKNGIHTYVRRLSPASLGRLSTPRVQHVAAFSLVSAR